MKVALEIQQIVCLKRIWKKTKSHSQTIDRHMDAQLYFFYQNFLNNETQAVFKNVRCESNRICHKWSVYSAIDWNEAFLSANGASHNFLNHVVKLVSLSQAHSP